MNAMRMTFKAAVVLVAALSAAPGVKGRQASPTTAGPNAVLLTQAQLRQLPRTPADFSARLETVKARLKELRAGQEGPPPPDDTEAAERRKRLEARIHAWNEYQDVLQRAASFAEEIARLTGSKAMADSAEEIAGVEAEAASLEKQGPPRSVSDEELQSSEERLRDVEARVVELSDLQGERQARLDSGLERRRKELEAEEKQLQQPAVPPEQPAPKKPSPPAAEASRPAGERKARRVPRRSSPGSRRGGPHARLDPHRRHRVLHPGARPRAPAHRAAEQPRQAAPGGAAATEDRPR